MSEKSERQCKGETKSRREYNTKATVCRILTINCFLIISREYTVAKHIPIYIHKEPEPIKIKQNLKYRLIKYENVVCEGRTVMHVLTLTEI